MNISKFTQKSLEAVQNTEKLAYEYGNQQIDQEHLLYSLLTVEDSLIFKLITKMGISGDQFRDEVQQAIGKLPKVSGGQVYFSNDANKVLVNAEDEAKAMGDEYVSVEHLFLAMLKQPNKAVKELFRLYGITKESFLQALSTVRGNQRVVSDNPEATYDTLNKYGYDLVERARDQKLDPVIGRDGEIRNVVMILSRKTKNNPVLIGEPGVGKTAVVEGLAQAIVNGDVPAAIKNKEIISIDISGLEAGTQYRGSFEENIQNLVNEVKEAGNIILFFDEIHQILGAGSTGDGQGSKGLADILKPALSRGELTVIGATTQDEYRNTILKNAALARRFNEVKVNAPSAEDTFKILQGIRDLYEKHHNVILPDDVLKAAVDFSVQYIPQRSLPDKAIDLVDVTAAHLAAQHPVTDVNAVEHEIEAEKAKQEAAAAKEDYEAALNAKVRIEELEKKIANHTADLKVTATVNDVAESVERMTGIPVSQMGATDIERLKDMGHRLQTKVIGQDKAVEAVARAIRRNRAGFDEGNRPIGSFLFVGPTGVGKTELAKQLALDMFGTKDAIIRLDMSEYSDRTAVSKLIGTTAGYVGYDDNSNTLTERVRRNPCTIVILKSSHFSSKFWMMVV